MVVLDLLLATSDETEQRLLLLQAHCENGAAGLEIVLKLFVQVQRRLDLHKRAELRVVVLDVVPALVVFLDERVLSAHGDVVDSHIRLMASAELDLVNVVEVYYVQLLLLFVIILRRVNLERFYD